MSYFILVIAVLLNTGVVPPTVARSFPTEAACEAAGMGVAKILAADATVDRAAWLCQEIDFSQADPKPSEPIIPGDRKS